MKTIANLACCLVLLVGCSQEVPAPEAAKAAPQAAAPVPATTGAVAPNRLDATHFSVSLAKVDCSAGPAATATVKWDAGAEKVTGVAIFVASPGNERKLWLEGGASGEETTGPWVFANTVFAVEAKDSGETLATYTVDAIPCGQ